MRKSEERTENPPMPVAGRGVGVARYLLVAAVVCLLLQAAQAFAAHPLITDDTLTREGEYPNRGQLQVRTRQRRRRQDADPTAPGPVVLRDHRPPGPHRDGALPVRTDGAGREQDIR